MTARPDEMIFMVFMDYTNCSDSVHRSEIYLPGGTLPLGVEIQQLSFSFNCPPLQNMYFMKFRIINKSSLQWDSTYFTIHNEPDIGDPTDDSNGCDTLRNIAFAYNQDNDDNSYYGINPPSAGYRLLQTPIYSTGNNNDTLKLPYDTLTGYKMRGMTGFKQFARNLNECTRDPDYAVHAYNFMRGKNGCGEDFINWYNGAVTTYQFSGNACSRTGWYDSVGGEYRTIANSGPFTMNSGDTQIVVLSFMITRDGGNNFQNVCALQSISDSALKYYYNDFRTCIPIDIQPISTEIPAKFELLQNYPNPFNPATKIHFSIPAFVETTRRVVSLRIYDVLGKEISVLVNENLKPGIYEIEWNAENIPSGVYFYSLITNNFTQTKRMVVLK